MPRKKTTNRKRLKRVSARAERREVVDWDRFAYALLQHVRLTMEQQTKGSAARDKP